LPDIDKLLSCWKAWVIVGLAVLVSHIENVFTGIPAGENAERVRFSPRVLLAGTISLHSLNGQMRSILKRLASIARSHIGRTISKRFDFPESGSRFDRDMLSGKSGQTSQSEEIKPKWPQQVVDDLSIFGLKPPSSLEEVKKVRNREVMKYHTDHFTGDTEKEETSKRIMQIYNTAFDRLEKWYGRNSASQSGR
jgi:hypothetical protein